MGKNRLRNFFLLAWIIIGLIFNVLYIAAGALEGYGLANLFEFLYAAILALIFTAIYFIFISGSYLKTEESTKNKNKNIAIVKNNKWKIIAIIFIVLFIIETILLSLLLYGIYLNRKADDCYYFCLDKEISDNLPEHTYYNSTYNISTKKCECIPYNFTFPEFKIKVLNSS